jgi:hypothetical protein
MTKEAIVDPIAVVTAQRLGALRPRDLTMSRIKPLRSGARMARRLRGKTGAVAGITWALSIGPTCCCSRYLGKQNAHNSVNCV